jgi:hypothetical protein
LGKGGRYRFFPFRFRGILKSTSYTLKIEVSQASLTRAGSWTAKFIHRFSTFNTIEISRSW